MITATSTIKESVKQDFALTITPKEYVEIAPTWLEIVSVETSVTVGENLSLTVNVEPEDASKSVTWSSDKESVATVSPAGVLRGQGEGKAVITATSKLNDAIKDTIEIEVTPAKGIEPTVDWAAQPFASHDEYMNAAKETPLKVKGTVTYVEPAQVSKDGTHKAASYYIQSGKQGFYVYKQNVDVFPVKLNKTYEVGGFKAYSFHTNEIAKVEHFAEIDESLPWEVVDIFALNVGDTSATKDYTGSYVSLNEAIVDSVPSGFTSAFNIMVSNSKGSIALRADPKVAGQEEFDAIVEKAKTLVVGGSVSVKGLLNTFGYGSPSNQIQIVKASELQINKVTPQQYVDAAASNAMYLPNSVLASQNSIQLPTAVENFPGVEVSWTSDNAAISSTGVVTHSSELVDVTLTATLAYEGATATKQFVVTVFETDDTHYNVVHTLDLEDADPASSGSWGVSPTKSTYDDEGTNAVSLGSPKKASWKLFNALIAGTEADKLVGTLSIRAKGNEDQARSARSRFSRITNSICWSSRPQDMALTNSPMSCSSSIRPTAALPGKS